MDARDLLVDSLLPSEKREDPSPVALLSRDEEMSPSEIIFLGESLIRSIKRGTRRVAYKTGAFHSAATVFLHDSPSEITIPLALEYEKNGEMKQELIDQIKKDVYLVKETRIKNALDNAFKSTTEAIDYLREFFKDETAEELSLILGVSVGTVKRYLGGSVPNNNAANVCLNLARIFFFLEREKKMTTDEIIYWYKNEKIFKDRPTPISLREELSYYNSFRYFINRTIKKAIGFDPLL